MGIYRVGLCYFQLIPFAFYYEPTWLNATKMARLVCLQIGKCLQIH